MKIVTVHTMACMLCGESGRIVVDEAGLEAWESGVLIQDALPELSASEREQLMTGIHAECWDRAFPEED